MSSPSTTSTPGPRLDPPRYKLAVLTWLAIYPLVTVLLWLTGPISQQLPLPVVTLVLTIVLVSTLTWVVLPVLHRVFRGWLAPSPRRPDDET